MGHLMRQQPGVQQAIFVVDHCALGHTVVARFMMFEAEMRNLIAQRQQEVILTVVARRIERAGFRHQPLVVGNGIGRNVEGGVTVGGDIEEMLNRAFGGQRNAAEMPPGQHRRIHQRGQRSVTEADLPAVLVVDGQGGAVVPAFRNLQRRGERNIIRMMTAGIQQQLVPAHHVELRGG